jgi:hypothetical protein
VNLTLLIKFNSLSSCVAFNFLNEAPVLMRSYLLVSHIMEIKRLSWGRDCDLTCLILQP